MSVAWNGVTILMLGDPVPAKPGDNVYFFSQRKVYGIGEIVETARDVIVAENHSGVTSGKAYVQEPNDFGPLVDNGYHEDKIQRWVIAFQPAPYFFATGIDMDDLLASNEEAIKILRVFWRRSFIKFGYEENRAFKAAILREHRDCLLQRPEDGRIFECETSRSRSSSRPRISRYNSRLSDDKALYIEKTVTIITIVTTLQQADRTGAVSPFANWRKRRLPTCAMCVCLPGF